MDLSERKVSMRASAQHAAKQAVELALSVGSLSEKITERPARFEVDATWARGNIAAIRRELDELEALIDGREPNIRPAPKAA